MLFDSVDPGPCAERGLQHVTKMFKVGDCSQWETRRGDADSVLCFRRLMRIARW